MSAATDIAMATIRRARPEEAAALSDLAMRSKAVWGYDAAFLELCRPALTVSPDAVRTRPVYLAETAGGVPAGFYALAPLSRRLADLTLMFVAPEHIGQGHGRRLWRHMAATARDNGYREVELTSDPNAAAFYARMGARRDGWAASESIPGRRLPVFRFAVTGG